MGRTWFSVPAGRGGTNGPAVPLGHGGWCGPRRWLCTALVGLVALVVLWPMPAWGAIDAGNLGAQLFENHCAACHRDGGNIIRRSRTLKLGALERHGLASPEAIARIAASGIGQMGGYGDALGPGGPEAVGTWVWLQAQKAWIQG
jgi:cytochrome c6